MMYAYIREKPAGKTHKPIKKNQVAFFLSEARENSIYIDESANHFNTCNSMRKLFFGLHLQNLVSVVFVNFCYAMYYLHYMKRNTTQFASSIDNIMTSVWLWKCHEQLRSLQFWTYCKKIPIWRWRTSNLSWLNKSVTDHICQFLNNQVSIYVFHNDLLSTLTGYSYIFRFKSFFHTYFSISSLPFHTYIHTAS